MKEVLLTALQFIFAIIIGRAICDAVWRVWQKIMLRRAVNKIIKDYEERYGHE